MKKLESEKQEFENAGIKAVTASNRPDKRSILSKLLSDAKEGRINNLLVLDPGRITGDANEFCDYVKILSEYGVEVMTVDACMAGLTASDSPAEVTEDMEIE